MFQTTNQTKPGISILFCKNDVGEINKLLTKDYFEGSLNPVGEDCVLTLPVGLYGAGFGGLQFYCYGSAKSDEAYLLPACPFCTGYNSVVWIKDLDGNILWKNWNYNEDGTGKQDDEEEDKEMKKTLVRVVSGDIAQQKADALITAINSGGLWFGGIDGVIQRLAGGHFHTQAKQASPLFHEKTIVATGDGCSHNGKFQNVIFVVDDLESPLRNIVYKGLSSAVEAGFKTVTLPTIRMGVMLGTVEKTAEDAVNEMVHGIKEYMSEFPNSPIDEIIFVVYNDKQLQTLLNKAIAKIA